MSLKIKSNYNNNEGPPSYQSINKNTDTHNLNNIIATYTVKDVGFFKSNYIIKKDKENKSYNIKVSHKTAKLIGANDIPIASIKHDNFQYMNTAWNICNLEKSSNLYSNIELFIKTFDLCHQYKLIFKKHDNSEIDYTFILEGKSGSTWKLYQSNLLILQYNVHTFQSNSLVQYSYINDDTFQIILLALIFVTKDFRDKMFQSSRSNS